MGHDHVAKVILQIDPVQARIDAFQGRVDLTRDRQASAA
jgi:hypothetical protein